MRSPVLGAGDTLLMTRLDRLVRSTRDLLITLALMADKGAGFPALADTWADAKGNPVSAGF